MFVTHIALARSVEDEKAVLEYRANGSTETARVRQLALLTSRSLSDVQSQILLMTAEGATDKRPLRRMSVTLHLRCKRCGLHLTAS